MVQRSPAVIPTAGAVLELIRRGEAATRAEVAAVTGLSRTAVTARLAALMRAGLLVEGEEGPSTGGRPPAQLQFNAASGAILAVALGRSRTQLAVCDLAGAVLASSEFDHDDGQGPEVVMPRVRTGLDVLLRDAQVDAAAVRGVGVSMPGTVDHVAGASSSSPIMRGWDGVPLASYFHDLGTLPVHVENDANALALSEANAHLLNHPDLIVLKASTGLGCGIFVEGRLVRGATGAAGEFGHLKVAAAADHPCRCGDVGCLEAIASGWSLVQAARTEGLPVAHVRELVAAAMDGDARALRLIRDSGRRVGEAMAGVVNLLNPDAVVVCGDLAVAYDVYVVGMRETLYAGATAAASRSLEILPGHHGEQAGIVGCAQAAIADVLSPEAVDELLSA